MTEQVMLTAAASPPLAGARRIFYLGAHHDGWLSRVGLPLFVSRKRLERRKRLPRAIAPWALDSGGFTELEQNNGWTIDAKAYVALARRYRDEIGLMSWAAPQDWMCEEEMVARTGLSVSEHQRRTLENYLELKALAPDVPWIPVLQGWKVWDYWQHVEDYAAAGVDLRHEPLVGVGTVCRRQDTHAAASIFQSLYSFYDLHRLHGFGLKKVGIRLAGAYMVSCDSMAWSDAARRAGRPLFEGHEKRHKNCANCLDAALLWRSELPDEWLSARGAA